MRKDRYGRFWNVGDTVLPKDTWVAPLFEIILPAKVEKIVNYNNDSGFVLVLSTQTRPKDKGYDPGHFITPMEKVLYGKT